MSAAPAPSIIAYPYLATAWSAGAVSSDENGPRVMSTWSAVISVR